MSKTLKDLSVETEEYLIANGGWPSEFDMSINDISREKIRVANQTWGQCWLVKINRYDEEAESPYAFTLYKEDMRIYNFGWSFAIPSNDPELLALLIAREIEPYTGTQGDYVHVNKIFERVEAIGGIALIWA